MYIDNVCCIVEIEVQRCWFELSFCIFESKFFVFLIYQFDFCIFIFIKIVNNILVGGFEILILWFDNF